MRTEHKSTQILLGLHVILDTVRHEVFVDDNPIEVTAKEYDLLCLLASHTGKIFTHEDLLKEVWGAEYFSETNYLRVYINRLRRKLGPYGEDLIRTKPGMAYRIEL
ncbi:Transcriptional regulatory protein, C terminal [Ferrithrix thermotolerans DSM 19514]|uniref:Transcriptional regulatory protein, C terminal n=1 Tax=Ferrithrix thermotolerans DSM 19514 TaxID=1121881 RepID=A0A1M4SW03_9ACTN|nr:Transcriptional regulatory protein, C terminal [Ferrithrix thermotolerans DSM 19514]